MMDVLKRNGAIKNTFPRERRRTFDDRVIEALLFGSFKSIVKVNPPAREPYSDESKTVALYEPSEKGEENAVANIPGNGPPDKETGKNPVYLELLHLRRERWLVSEEKKQLIESNRRLRFMVEGDKTLKAVTSGPLAIEEGASRANSIMAKKEESMKGDGEKKSAYGKVKGTHQESQQKWFNLEGYPDWQHHNERWRSANRDELWNGGSYPPDWNQDCDSWNQSQAEWYSQDRSPQDYPPQDESWSQAPYSEWPPQQSETWDSGMGFGGYSFQDAAPYDTVWSLGHPQMVHGRGSQRFQSQYQRGYSNSGPFPRSAYPPYNVGNSQPQEESSTSQGSQKPKPSSKSKRARGKGKRRQKGGSHKKVKFEDETEDKDGNVCRDEDGSQ